MFAKKNQNRNKSNSKTNSTYFWCKKALNGRQFAFYECQKYENVCLVFRKEDYKAACELLRLGHLFEDCPEAIGGISYSYDGHVVESGSNLEKGFEMGLLHQITRDEFMNRYWCYRVN